VKAKKVGEITLIPIDSGGSSYERYTVTHNNTAYGEISRHQELTCVSKKENREQGGKVWWVSIPKRGGVYRTDTRRAAINFCLPMYQPYRL